MADFAKLGADLSEIIRIQSDVIDALYLMLLQHVTVEELDKVPCMDDMERAARLKADIMEET